MTEQEAIACYILSKKQGSEMIAFLMGKTVDEVESAIAKAGRFNTPDKSDREDGEGR